MVLAAAALVVAACGGAATPVPPTAPPATAAPATAAPATAAPSAAAGMTIGLATNATMGPILVGGNGMTLYTFAKDTGADKSVCSADCAKAWPPLVVASGQTPTADPGVTGTVATYPRDDGTTGVSYNGHPLYYFAADKAAGDVNGEGKGGVWYAARASGVIPPPVTPAPSAGASAPPSAEGSPSGSSEGDVYTVAKAQGSAAVGAYLTGEDGMTLYTFKPDAAAAGKSTCNGDCATAWPPFILEDGETAVPGDGVSGSIATITRDDNSQQVTYNGAPLYYFSQDKSAGDTTGQGKSGVWFVAAP